MKKWFVSITLTIVLMVTMCVSVVASSNLGTLSCWYSGDSKIGRWSQTNITVYVVRINPETNTAYFPVVNAFAEASSKWSNALDISIVSGKSEAYSSAPIVFYGGTIEEINTKATFNLTSTTNGVTRRASSLEGYWTYGSASKEGRLIVSAEGCIVDKGKTLAQYIKTCTHELGHALGWSGHSSNSSDVMYGYSSNITELTSRDINHLVQIY